MEIIRKLRKQLGLNQEEMANLLGSSRSRLSHAEAGRRLLEAPAMEQLAVLLRASGESSLLPDYPAQQENISDAVAYHLSAIRHELTGLLQHQKELTEQYQQNQLLAHCIQRLMQSSHYAQQTKRQKRWIDELQYKTAKRQRQSAAEIGFFLDLDIKTRQFQQELCERYLENGQTAADQTVL